LLYSQPVSRKPGTHVQLSIENLRTTEELLAGHGLRVLSAQKWFSLHSTHRLSSLKKPGRQVHAVGAALPAEDVLLCI